MSYGFLTPDAAHEVIRSLLLKGNGKVVQGNVALRYRVYAIMAEPFWALIENSLIDAFCDVPRPDIVEAVAMRLTKEQFDDLNT
jgi:hypothetical protein